MQDVILAPTSAGQVCKIITPLEGENPNDAYIVCEDPSPFEDDDNIYVANLKDLQRNFASPLDTPQIPILKGDLTVIANDLEAYIKSWNK